MQGCAYSPLAGLAVSCGGDQEEEQEVETGGGEQHRTENVGNCRAATLYWSALAAGQQRTNSAGSANTNFYYCSVIRKGVMRLNNLIFTVS